MKKIFLLLVLSLMLVGCTEITDDLKPKKPTAEFKITGETTQIFNTIEDLEDITFEIILKNFEENEILKEDIKIKWYMQEDISEYKELEDNIDMYDYLLIINRRTTLNIKAVISFKLNDKTETIDIVQPVQIVEKETHIALTNDFEGEKVNNIIKLKLGDLALNEIEFTATLFGNLTHKTGSFVVEKRNELNEVVKTESFIVENLDELVTDDKIVVKHTYLFNEIYSYVIYFEAGKYRSSDNYLNVNYGDFGITLLGEKVYNSDNIEDRVISFNLLDQDVIGKGQYVLYLNGQEIMRDNKLFTYTHTDKAVGGYLYHMEFIPTDKENPIQKTDKLLLVNGVVVNTEEEFVEAINNKVRGIILGSDIKYMSTNELVVDYPMTLFGDGKKISVMSTSIDIFLKVKSNDVNFSNIVFEKGKYQVMYEKTTNGYLEDMTFNLEQGRTSFDSIIKGDFDMDAGLYVDRSLVEVHNTTIVGGGIIGIRIEATEEVKSILTVTGTFDNIDYMNDGVAYRSIMQIGTGTSPEGSVIVAGQGFFDIAVPFSVSTDSKNLIKLWSNSEDRMRWILNSGAVKKQMIIGDSIDFYGVMLDLIISKDQTMMFNLGIVYTILDIVGPKGIYGIVEIENLDGSKIEGMKYLIKGHTENSGPVEGYENGEDLLLYYNDSNELVRPLVPNKPGTYVVRLKIGESLELGTFEIVVK